MRESGVGLDACRDRLRGQPGGGRVQVLRVHATDELPHAVWCRRGPNTGAPCAKLRRQIILRHTQQARHRRRHSQQPAAMTGIAGRYVQARVALRHQRPSALEYGRGRFSWLRRWIWDPLRAEISRDLVEVVVGLILRDVRHHGEMTPAFPEIHELIEEITRRLSGDPGKVTLTRGAALVTVTARAGFYALLDRIERGPRSWLRRRRIGGVGAPEGEEGRRDPREPGGAK